jgi:hypothetical protein
VLRPLAEHLVHDLPVGEAQDVIEEPACVLGIAPRVRAAQHGDGAALAEPVADRVGEVGGFRERADEQKVEVGRQLRQEVLPTGIADVADVVARLLAPDADDLWHDAGQVGVHHPAVEAVLGGFRDEIEHPDVQAALRGRDVRGRRQDHEAPARRGAHSNRWVPGSGAE